MSQKVEPTLESITVSGKYDIPFGDFEDVVTYLDKTLKLKWRKIKLIGDSIRLIYKHEYINKQSWKELINESRVGVPIDFSVTVIGRYNNRMIVEVQCLPIMYYRICSSGAISFTKNEVQEALLECKLFVKQVMSGLKGKEVEPVSVYPVIPRREIRSRLLNLSLKKVVEKLDTAERHMVQNNFPEALKSCRTAFEKMVDWQMDKRGLEKTNNYKNNLERLKSKGYLDKHITKLLENYYRYLSEIAVHERAVIPPGIFEAQMGFGITLTILDYLANKLP